MKPRFELDTEVSPRPLEMLIDPEAYDASEQQFAASLEETPRPRFVVEEEPPAAAPARLSIQFADTPEPAAERRQNAAHAASRGSAMEKDQASTGRKSGPPDSLTCAEGPPPAGIEMLVANNHDAAQPVQTDLLPLPDPDAWRQEVAARVNSYRSRKRSRGPRYPSLKLSFEPSEPSRNTHPAGLPASAPATRQAVAVQSPPPAVELHPPPPHAAVIEETTARIIEFPRSANAPPRALDELADPVLDRPRILEAPELAPPPPALGGILMDPVETEANERRPGFEMPLQSAPMARRLAATTVDAGLVLSALTAFAYIFFRITAVVPPLQQMVGTAVGLLGLFWAAYQYLLLVCTGTTPGLKLAKLRLSRFDGSAAPRRIRRWRVLASVLSGLSLGLGYAWCFLDEDELCWHDRITHTYMAPRN